MYKSGFFVYIFAAMVKQKILFLTVFLSLHFSAKCQLKQVYNELKHIDFQLPSDSIKGWKHNGRVTVNINQSNYSQWQGEGNNAVELDVLLNHRFNYQTHKMLWDNYIIANFGLNKLNGQGIRKTQDRIEYNTIVGIKLPQNWSVSYFLNVQTQTTNSFDYSHDIQKNHRINGFLAPLYAATGPGIMWKKNNRLNFNIAPITYKLTYINGNIYRYDSKTKDFVNDNNIEILGIEPGKKFKYQLGFYSAALYAFKLTQNIKVENSLSLYSNYLDDFSNIDFDYTMRMDLGINDYLSTQIILQTRYDDDAYKGLQVRESVGVGLKFKF